MTPDFFFFQAEDGIRDLVRSRGLGDVYKRQRCTLAVDVAAVGRGVLAAGHADGAVVEQQHGDIAVSYTHLTLPTSDLV